MKWFFPTLHTWSRQSAYRIPTIGFGLPRQVAGPTTVQTFMPSPSFVRYMTEIVSQQHFTFSSQCLYPVNIIKRLGNLISSENKPWIVSHASIMRLSGGHVCGRRVLFLRQGGWGTPRETRMEALTPGAKLNASPVAVSNMYKDVWRGSFRCARDYSVS